MSEKNEHAQLIEKWASHALSSTSHDEVVHIFNDVFSRIWSDAELVLGAITLRAASGRVVAVASDLYRWIEPSQITRKGLEINATVLTTDLAELKSGVSFLLAEFLTVLGNLTANVISPKLHALIQTEVKAGDNNGSTAISRNDENSKSASARAGIKK